MITLNIPIPKNCFECKLCTFLCGEPFCSVTKETITDETLMNLSKMRNCPINVDAIEPTFSYYDDRIGEFNCGNCGKKLGTAMPNYCWYCGRAVKKK